MRRQEICLLLLGFSPGTNFESWGRTDFGWRERIKDDKTPEKMSEKRYTLIDFDDLGTFSKRSEIDDSLFYLSLSLYIGNAIYAY